MLKTVITHVDILVVHLTILKELAVTVTVKEGVPFTHYHDAFQPVVLSKLLKQGTIIISFGLSIRFNCQQVILQTVSKLITAILTISDPN